MSNDPVDVDDGILSSAGGQLVPVVLKDHLRLYGGKLFQTLADGTVDAGANEGFGFIPIINGPPSNTPIARTGYAQVCIENGTPKKLWIWVVAAWFYVELTA